MKRYTSAILIPFLLISMRSSSFGQSKIKDGSVTGSSSLPDASAIMELESNNKGLLLPRVALSATNLATPLTAHIAGMTVYNTNSAGTAPNDVTPGYYYNDGAKWVKLNTEPWYNKSTMAPATGNTDTIYTMGRVGIGTNSPQRSLHIAGSSASAAVAASGYNLVSPTIRVAGFNDANNSAHRDIDSANSVKTVFATAEGDLVMGNAHRVLGGSPNLSDDISTSVTTSSATGVFTNDTIMQRTFTLRQSSVVTISYDLSVDKIQMPDGTPIISGRAKVIQSYIKFLSVPATATALADKNAAQVSTSYTNSATGGTIPGGFFYHNGFLQIEMPPGTYVIGLIGSVYGGSEGVKATFGDSAVDRFSIMSRLL